MERHYNSIKRRIIKVFLFFIFIIISCFNSGSIKNISSGKIDQHKNEKIKSEYIITVKQYCDEFLLRKFFYEYGILEIHFIKDNEYLMKFANDPGLKELTKEAKKTNTIEEIRPNYKNKANTADY